MADPSARATPAEREIEAFTRTVVANAAHLRMPELFGRQMPEALYWRGRHGVTTVALHTTALNEYQLLTILRYRLAQYIMAGFVEPRLAAGVGLDHEPLSTVTPEDIHVLAGSALTGEILCYCTLRALAGAPAGATMRTRARPLFPVEQTHGPGLFSNLRVLPDLPVRRVRELGRFARNQLASRVSATVARAPVEVGLAVMRLLSPCPDGEVAAAVGDIEEHVAKANLDFLHCPSVIIRGTSPREVDGSIHTGRLRGHTFVPFAFLCADLAASQDRLKAIEDALSLPDERALRTLFALKRTAGTTPSRLVPTVRAASA